LKRQVSIPDDLPGLVEKLMAKRLTDAISLAKKAGQLVSGFTKVEEMIEAGSAAYLIHAADASEDGAAKLDRKFKALRATGDADGAIIRELDSSELSLAIGRANVVHAAASDAAVSQRIWQAARRLRKYRNKSD
jgi:hypothetical protein